MTDEQRVKSNKYINDWKKNNRDRINFLMPRGYKDRIAAAADAASVTASEYIRRAIDAALDRDGK